MTLAEQFLQQGRQQGHHEGRQEGRQEGSIINQRRSVVDVLEVRFERVPPGLVEALEVIYDEGRLRALLRAATRAADLESFAREL